MSPCRVVSSHCRRRIRSTLCVSLLGSACLLDKSRTLTAQQGLGSRFPSFHHAHCLSSPSRGLAPPDKTWVYVLLLSTGSACLIAESRACTVGQGLGPRFASFHQAHRVSWTSRGSHSRTRLGSTFCLFPPGSVCLIAESRACTAGQGMGPRFSSLQQAQRFSSSSRIGQQVLGAVFASLHQAQRVFSISRELAPRNKSRVHVLPLSTIPSMFSRLVTGLHCAKRL